MDLQRINDKYIGIRSDIKQKERTVYLEKGDNKKWKKKILEFVQYVIRK